MQMRTIKSFVLRTGRVTTRQQYALDHWFAAYHLPAQVWCLEKLFDRSADTIIEIGFGMGQSLLQMAQTQPHVNFIGIEVHQAGIGSLVASLHEAGISNVRIAPYDAVDVFKNYLPDNSLAGIQIFFPDPWPKKRHHKRRLIQTDFVKSLISKLKHGGFIHCATDWQDYAETMHKVFEAESNLVNQQAAGGFSPRPAARPLTKFEQRGHLLGHSVWDLIYRRPDFQGD